MCRSMSALHICVKDDYFRADVLHAVEEVLSSDVLPDGSLGLFHPDNFTFGQSVYLSRVIAAAQAVEGVDSVRVDRFQRLDRPRARIAVGRRDRHRRARNRRACQQSRISASADG